MTAMQPLARQGNQDRDRCPAGEHLTSRSSSALPNSRSFSNWRGVFTSLITPFKDSEVDLEALARHVELQLESGISGFVACGTPGEASTLDMPEKISIIRKVIDVVGGRVPVLAATGTNDTVSTIALTLTAADLGADGVVIVTPYYNKPTQRGLVRHFSTVAAQSSLPILLHNAPSRTAVDLATDTIERLAEIPRIVGIVDATGDLSRPFELGRRVPHLAQFSGHDATAFGFNTMGGRGVVSAVSNVFPHLTVAMLAACERDDVHRARAIAHRLRPLVAALELEPEPATIKHALNLTDGICPDVRLPLVGVDVGTSIAIGEALRTFRRSKVLKQILAHK